MVQVVPDLPPEALRGKVDWYEVAQVARDNPGKWVEVPVPLSRGMTTQIKRRQVRAIDPDLFEIAARAVPGEKGKVTFYVRLRV